MRYEPIVTVNCATGETITETIELPDYTPGEVAAQQAEATKRIIDSITAAVQEHLDTTARLKNYDGILSACTYATSTVPAFAAEGQACVEWRDNCWATCYSVMAAVMQGQRAIRTAEELIAELPHAPW